MIVLAALALAVGADAWLHPEAIYKTRAENGANGQTYVSMTDPNALNLDGSLYGIGLCRAKSNASWQISMQVRDSRSRRPLSLVLTRVQGPLVLTTRFLVCALLRVLLHTKTQ